MTLPWTPLTSLSIVEASQLIRQQDLTPLALTQACLDRISLHDGDINAFVTLTAQPALEAAEQATREIRAGQWRGPLHGIPIAHKDVVLTRGVRTTGHSRAFEHWVPEVDAAVVSQLAAAGSVSLGKTACHELAFGSPARGDLFPPARNPWHRDHMPGSSSSGSGAAVAAGLCLAATGTDTGGSVRHPAAACGLVGLKPTRDLLSTAGVLALAPSMDHVGLITRSVRDSALMLSCLVPGPQAERSASLVPGAGLSLKGVRAGIDRRQLTQQNHDPEVWAAFEAALEVLQSLGLVLSEIDLPDSGKTVTAANTVIGFEAHLQFQGVLRDSPDRLGAGLHSKLRAAASIGMDDYHLASVFARAARGQVDAVLLSGVDVIVSPGREAPAERLDALMANPTAQRSACNRLYSLTGHPALTLPMGISGEGLPLAIQLASSHHAEAVILKVGAAFEDALGWHTDARNRPVNPPWARAVPG